MSDAIFFGYGSLVNAATHSYPDIAPATLDGWRRVWRHTDRADSAFLTAVPCPGSAIEGVTARVPDGDWAALDLREAAYARVRARIDHRLVSVYSIAEGRHGLPGRPVHILLSYLDVVVQGFLGRFGEAGVARFFETTDGWDTAVLDDRALPRYPRHQHLSDAETALVDRHLAARGAVRIAA